MLVRPCWSLTSRLLTTSGRGAPLPLPLLSMAPPPLWPLLLLGTAPPPAPPAMLATSALYGYMLLVFWYTMSSAYAHCIAQHANDGIVRGHMVALVGERKHSADPPAPPPGPTPTRPPPACGCCASDRCECGATPVGFGNGSSSKLCAMFSADLRQILALWWLLNGKLATCC